MFFYCQLVCDFLFVLLADFLVVNLLLGDYGSAHFSNLSVCYVVNVQGITRHLRLKLMVLINLKHVK